MCLKQIAVHMEDSKLNEVDSVNTHPHRVHGIDIQRDITADQIRLLVGNNQTPGGRILSANRMIAMTTILATTGSGPGQVSYFSHGIAVNHNARNIFVSDCDNPRIQKFTPNFIFIKEWGFEGSGNHDEV